ncbi:RluA family pseudouridine synthase [Natronosporangium hydrolyticum]|uniref:RNA pseudouridylate synthase n=1 Tax=Natronosporangium hydrolyticum TaxID=2811111 RepID=A0A895YDD6_9ACTN|nr:RluA family pseudouridine synthase [Natronosporangium hydrolyticum]QSB15814.1 RluA family pseudouridine synthase [Natronosporangium hydrolyticum]
MPMDSWSRIRAESLLFEDDAVLALNKPVGIAVTGERHDTDLVRLAAEAGEELFPVHRIDKVTSGLILFARRLSDHGALTRQFNKRTVDKAYLVITETTGLPPAGRVELPLSVGRKNRVRIAAPREAIVADPQGGHWTVPETELLDTKRYPAITDFTTRWYDDRSTLLVVRPRTGRRHQIRVHLAWIGHPILGDPLFDKAGTAARTYLHSWQLGFDAAWRGGERLQLVAPPRAEFWAPIGGPVDLDPADGR